MAIKTGSITIEFWQNYSTVRNKLFINLISTYFYYNLKNNEDLFYC